MIYTETTILRHIYTIIRTSSLASMVNGTVYKDERFRPLNSQKEDIVINIVSAIDGQYISGFANINVYVSDIEYSDGANVRLVPDLKRIEQIEERLHSTINFLSSGNILFKRDEVIGSQLFEENKQHFVNARLKFRISNI